MGVIVIIAVIIGAIAFFYKMGGSETGGAVQSNVSRSPNIQAGPAVKDWEVDWKPSAPIKTFGKCGEKVKWTLYEDGQLTIMGSGPMYDYRARVYEDGKRLPPWYSWRQSIRSVKVGKGINHLGEFAFLDCSSLKEAILACSSDKMPWGCFHSCEALEEIQIPNGVRTISDMCFLECKSLRAVRIPDGVEIIGDSAFYGCTNLVSASLPDSLREIRDVAFAFCPRLQQIRISKGTSYIAEDAFYNSGVSIPPRGL